VDTIKSRIPFHLKSYTQEASILDNGQSSSDEASMGDMMQ